MKAPVILAAMMTCGILAACSNAEAPAERSDSGAFGTGAAGTGMDGTTGVNEQLDNSSGTIVAPGTDYEPAYDPNNSTLDAPAPGGGVELDNDSGLDTQSDTMDRSTESTTGSGAIE